MSSILTLTQLHSALLVNDPQLVTLTIQLSRQSEIPETTQRVGADSFETFLADINSREFRKKSQDEQWALRTQRLQSLEGSEAQTPLTQCLQLHEILLALYARDDAFSRRSLLAIIKDIKLCYGPWRALKAIFKQAEANNDDEMYAALCARFDSALASGDFEISRNTLIYLTHRAWRYLRRQGESLPACYPDLACDVLAHYPDNTQWSGTWLANHIFYHESGDYNRHRFTFRSRPSTLLKYRAFTDSWRLSPRPLFSLLEKAQSEQVRRYASTALKTDFRASLRDVDPQWVTRLVAANSATIDDFVIWILDNVPRFEQSAFIQLGLHRSVLKLFESDSDNARIYAAKYARIHARDLPVSALIRLIDNSHKDVRTLASDLILARDARKDIGLEAWGEILETRYGNALASDALLKHFSQRELNTDWYLQRLLQPGSNGFGFARENLIRQHSLKVLGADFFSQLLQQLNYQLRGASLSVDFACEYLRTFNLNELDNTQLKTWLINDNTRHHVAAWIDEGLLSPTHLELDFLKSVAFHPQWQEDALITALKQQHEWAKGLEFSNDFAALVFCWLGDIRYFAPEQLSFDWLMILVQRSEAIYHDFAVEVMNKAFLPADFAPASDQQESPDAVDVNAEITVDFEGASFLFTGKLAKMTRGEAKSKVTAAGGSNASGVNKKLDWLVIGDEGSSLYGEGRKGSKQVKAEDLIADGAALRIISETAFLQMLSGEQREFSDDAIEAGCEQLWKMLNCDGAEDAPLRLFALSYIRQHHPEICLAETDRPVDPGAEMPPEFLNFERFEPLFNAKLVNLRNFALELAHWEFARWQPSIEQIVQLSESKHEKVKAFVAQALTADEQPEHKRYRLDPAVLTADAVYSFCESQEASARKLGMKLIGLHPRLQLPQELFRLTESPDRSVRAFVIRRFWHWYRERGISHNWQPQSVITPIKNAGTTALKKHAAAQLKAGNGPLVKPDTLPAPHQELQQFLRRILFEIAPGRLPSTVSDEQSTTKERKLKRRKLNVLPTRQAKLSLIETLRDIAVEEVEFARHVLPLLQEFKGSRGKSEHAACLVAVTRIKAQHAELATDQAVGAPL